jgi:hypothetical protein
MLIREPVLFIAIQILLNYSLLVAFAISVEPATM